MAEQVGDFFRYIRDEESQTDFFVSLLSYTETSRVLNEIHQDDDLEFDETAQIIATQRSGLPHSAPENEKARTLDWVVKDQTKLVGYESKRGDKLTGKQLREEYQKLEQNTVHREVHLFAFTEDLTDPGVAADYSWKGWSEVGRAVIDLKEKSEILEIMSDIFKEQGYEVFTGFTEFEQDEQWFVAHQNEAVNLAIEAAELVDGLTYRKKTDPHSRIRRNLEQVKENDYRGFAPPYYMFMFYPIGYKKSEQGYDITEEGWDIEIVVPALHNDVYVQLNAYPAKDNDLRELFRGNAEALTDLIISNGMHVEASYNSLVKEIPPLLYDDSESILEVLREKVGESNWKRLRIGWEINTNQAPEEILQETVNRMEELHEIFYNGVEQRQEF